jgi:hypothetical protein
LIFIAFLSFNLSKIQSTNNPARFLAEGMNIILPPQCADLKNIYLRCMDCDL